MESELYALLEKVAERVLEHKKAVVSHLKPQLLEFCLAVCERVLRKELSHPEVFARHLDSLLPAFEEDEMKVFLAPDDLALVKPQMERVRFLPDPHMKRGDCRIETDTQILNASIVRQLEDLHAKIV